MRRLAKRFKVSFSFVASLLAQVKQTGQVAPKAHGRGHPRSIRATGETFLSELIENQPDLILEEIRDEYNEHFKDLSVNNLNIN